jgi:N-acetylglutamate synthase-like GNAT family acetyltransferase
MIIVELHNLAEKAKWMKRFFNSYSGSTTLDSSTLYGSNVKFFVAERNGASLGFVRINDKSSFFPSDISIEVWNLADAYVKPPYRSSGVLKALVQHVVRNSEVRMLHIETNRFLNNLDYYKELGFNNFYTVHGGELTWAFQDDIWPYVGKSKKV